MPELLDIVDEHNNPTGKTKLRSEVHKDGDWHRVVHIYVVNSKGEFLTHLRSPEKDLHPNKWDTKFGGHLVAGQTTEQALLLELEQEIGIKAQLSEFRELGTARHDNVTNKEFVTVYSYLFDGDLATLVFNDSEVVEVKWMQPAEIIEAIEKNPEGWTTSSNGFAGIMQKFESKQ